MSNPGSIADRDSALWLSLTRDRHRDVRVTVILIGDVDVVSRPHVVSDLDREVTHDSAPAPNQTPVSDHDDPVRDAFLARHHPCRQSDVLADQCPRPHVDVPLVEDGRGGPHDVTAGTEAAEGFSSPVIGPDSGPSPEPVVETGPRNTQRPRQHTVTLIALAMGAVIVRP